MSSPFTSEPTLPDDSPVDGSDDDVGDSTDDPDTSGTSDEELLTRHSGGPDEVVGPGNATPLARAKRRSALFRGQASNKSVATFMDTWDYDYDDRAPYTATWTEEVWFDVITTGGNDHLRLANAWGFKTGGRLDTIDRLAEDGIPIHFIDMDWHDPDFPDLLRAAEEHNPQYIVGGDYATDHSNIETINDRARQLKPHCENVIVVPHGTQQVERVPEWAVVGYSVPTSYGSTDASPIEYSGRDIHLLGGSPERQMEMIREFGDDIVSIDGNSINKSTNITNHYWHGSHPRSQLTDPFIKTDRNFEAYERSLMHWSYKMRERASNGWFDGDSPDVLSF